MDYRLFNGLSFYPDASFLRYSMTGLGAYPYRYSAPQTPLKVRLDGVPVKSFSPFGPDMELLPWNTVDKIDFNGIDTLNIATKDSADSGANTEAFFLLGPGRRFDFNLAYENSLSDSSKLFLGGLSNATHGGNDNALKSELRNYYLKYNRIMKNGVLTVNARALRDRDGLVNLSSLDRMGERKTDETSFSAGLKDYRLSEKFNLSPTVYYSSDNSRFARYGYKKSLTEKTAGINARLDRSLGNTLYAFDFTSDTYFFDSKIHDDSWTRNETGLSGTFRWTGSGKMLQIKGGASNSSKYGAGAQFGALASWTIADSVNVFTRGSIYDGFPDTGQEYFTALVFSDSSTVSDLDKYHVSELETGLKLGREKMNLSFAGFVSSTDSPFFTPSPAVFGGPGDNTTLSLKSGTRKYAGYHFNGSMETVRKFRYLLDFSGSQRFGLDGSGNTETWPYPSFELFSRLRANGDFFKGNLNATAFGAVSLYNWEDAGTTPKGFYFSADIGLVLRVKTVELFYKIENITGEQIYWFDTLGWSGRNELWGARWIFRD